jgi:transcription elongation factor GreA
MSEEYYLTSEGAEKLRIELEELKGPKREDLSRRLKEAIEQGDLSENADYSKAKEDQGFLEGRIQEIEAILGNAKIIEEGKSDGTVNIGSHITIQEADYPPEEYHLVGPTEANPREGRISHESPIGIALMGRKKGDEVKVKTPGGEIKLKILKIT